MVVVLVAVLLRLDLLQARHQLLTLSDDQAGVSHRVLELTLREIVHAATLDDAGVAEALDSRRSVRGPPAGGTADRAAVPTALQRLGGGGVKREIFVQLTLRVVHVAQHGLEHEEEGPVQRVDDHEPGPRRDGGGRDGHDRQAEEP